MDALFRFDNYVFNSAIGELTHLHESGTETSTRLQPQPSKLLKLLLENHPNVVSHEQIRAFIWPDVHVDFDGSIHFCVRQIRAALHDNAAQPKFIETIARRGYRWIPDIKSKSESTAPNGLATMPKKTRIKTTWLLVLIGIAACAALFYGISSYSNGQDSRLNLSAEKTRIAIMPFQPTDETDFFFGNNLGYSLLETLTNQYQAEFEIIGPTTTVHYTGQPFQKLVDAYKIDFIINGRFSMPDKKNIFLGEIIRASDGAHIWVESFDASVASDSILARIQGGIDKALLNRAR
jgi:DNA-binding winged helix-turn-helix (wHTH) protein/TolB-like protein